ncbi:membrane protein insertase YidC [uncultured Sphingomonas sp.]|uniref:membrane protein insertase YidC n=1 Tax=uncultured Sphingomonas sp. TaxID=158754 RepID=UPI0035C9A068
MNNDDRRNFIAFLVLAAVILIGWQWAQHRLFPPANPPATKIVNGKAQPVDSPAAAPTAATPGATGNRTAVLAATQRVRIETPALRGSINLKGARLDDLLLLRHHETVAANAPPVRLFSPAGAPQAYFAQAGWRGGPAPDAVWRASAPVLAPGRPVTLETDGAAGQRFRLEIAVDGDYLFTIRQTVTNGGTTPIAVTPYALVNRLDPLADKTGWNIHVGPMSVHDGAADYGQKFKDIDAAPQQFASTGGWLGFTDKYWLAALIPDQAQRFQGEFRAGAGKDYQGDIALGERRVGPGQSLTTTIKLFAGAKETRLLDRYTDAGVAQKLDYALDWGWFRLVEKPIFYYLDWLFRMVGNFGVAIVLLTVTIRLLMFPIAQRQFASMAKMRVIQPKMKALQERHADDKERMQREVMQLYKTEKVNPLAGCLPTFLQIPIFYALYKVLMLTIEMRHQPFAGWIRDLSAPDPLTPINLFGVLPFDPPGVLHLGVLAILLGITMWLQFRMNPSAPDPATQQVMGLMPWVMMFIFAPLAAGLQLYYVASNLISIGQQRLLYAQNPALKVQPT